MQAKTRVPVILLGLGKVGRALLGQILESRETLARRRGIALAVTGLADSQALLFDPAGLPDEALSAALQAKRDGGSLAGLPGRRPPQGLPELLAADAILVDVTATEATGAVLSKAREAGCGVVLANKHPLAAPWPAAQALYGYPRLWYETTVGAGLPVIATLRTLLDTADRVTAIEGCLSGTLGYVVSQLGLGVPYSEAVSQARTLGYTEPDPREDLSGRDVARKALILARTAGWPLEMADLTVEPLYPEPLSRLSADEFMATMDALDEPFEGRFREAAQRGQTLRYLARIDARGGSVGLTRVPAQGLWGALHGPVNYVAFHTGRYDAEPLVIAGPGAGPAVTAAGVLGDIVNLALERAA